VSNILVCKLNTGVNIINNTRKEAVLLDWLALLIIVGGPSFDLRR
jgi:hypothetical protein